MYSTLAINNSDVAIGTIALTIKRMDLYVEVVEGGGAEWGSKRKKGEDAENEERKKCEKIGAREAKVLPRCGAALGACVSLCAWCTCTRVIRSVQSSWVCVCVCTRTCVYVLLFLCMKVCRKGEEKKQQGQNVIELVSKWEKEKKRANYRNCRGQFSASLSPSKLAALLRLCSI